ADTSALYSGVFTDANEVSEWAKGPMSWAIDNGIVTGNDNNDGTFTLDPTATASRERLATVIWRVGLSFGEGD
ncbi:MAG: S-layer homology domain-containing protein, partial [Eggerthellaceae bacterium]|nr:S-layer homology domain-containing protein [Eggerthellaceae bacterium]